MSTPVVTDNHTCASCHKCCSFSMLLGRFLLSAIFLLSGVGKFLESDAISQFMASHGISFVPFFLYTAAIIEILGGLSILFGLKIRWGAFLLLLYLIPVTLVFHRFWNVGPVEGGMQMIQFLKNLAIMGGLVYAIAVGAGKFSIDHLYHSHEKKNL